MQHDKHFGLPRIFASILAMFSLLTLAETRAQQSRAADGHATTTKETHQLETAAQSDAPPEPASGLETSTTAKPSVITEAPGTEATLPRSATRLKALELPALAKLTPLDKAYLDAFSILREDNDCSRFYGGPRAIEALNQLRLQLKTSYFDRSVGLRMHGKIEYTTNNSSGLSYRLFEKAELNSNGPFYKATVSPLDSRITRVGEFSANTREARVTILLHELGHMILTGDNHFVLPNDGDDPLTSRENTTRVIDVCRQQIKGQSQISFERALASLQTTSDAKPSQLAVITAPARSAWANIGFSTP